MAGSTRKRVSGSSKGKRWHKGQSSSSNPETSTHRQAAKNRIANIFGSQQGSRNSQLTQDALRKHEQSFADPSPSSLIKPVPVPARNKVDVLPPPTGDNYRQRDEDADSLSINSCNTFISGWSQCTNETFLQVENFWNSNSAQAKEICAILAAVAEVIRNNGGKETETEYFAALMTVLVTVESEESLSAVSYLLRLVIKRVPHSVLKVKFSDVGKKLFDVLGRHSTNGSPMLLKSILLCFASLFRVQDPVVWSEHSTLQLYHGLLSFISHSKPKVRKAAHMAVCSVLKGSQFLLNDNGPDHHPAAGATAKLCQQLIEKHSAMKEDNTVALYVLGLLKDVMSVFPQHYVKSSCEMILKLMTLSNVLISSVAMQALHGLFISQPKPTSLPSQLNAQIINALYDYQPTENDSQPAKAWLVVMCKAHINLHRQDEKLCLSHLPRFFNSAMSYLLSHRSDINKASLDTMKTLLFECIKPSSELIELSLKNTPNDCTTPIHKIIRCIESGLQYKYNTCWPIVLQLIAITFEVLGKVCPSLLRTCLRSMCELRQGYKFPHTTELDHAVGIAVRVMGPRQVLTTVPLNIDGSPQDDMNFPNSWLLPVLRDYVEGTELKYFNQHLLPLAINLYKSAEHYKEKNRLVESKAYDVLQYQIWSMLPGFLTNTVDLPTEFKKIAKILGAALSNRTDIRLEICNALRTVIKKSCFIEANEQTMSTYAKNYLPILFNIYTTELTQDDGTTLTMKSQLPILDTAKSYLSIAETSVIHEMFDKASLRILSDEVSIYSRYTVMDLLIAMIPYINIDRLNTVLKNMKPLLKNKDRSVQKKAYRMLEVACSSSSMEEGTSTFLKTNLCRLQDLLVSVRKQCKDASRAPRLHCLSAVVKRMPVEHEEFINVILDEAVESTKAVGLRARTAALDLVCDMAKYVIKSAEICHNPSIDAFDDYCEMILGGLTDDETATVTASIVTMQCLIREFRMYLSTELISKILNRLCSQLHTKNNAIIKTTLECMKDMVKHINDRELGQHVEQLVTSLVRWDDETKHKFRYRVRPLFLRLCRKFSFEMIDKLAPPSYHKMILNMKKTTEREKRHKIQRESGDQEDDDDWTSIASTRRKAESFDEILAETDSDDDEMKSVRTEKSTKSSRSQKKSRLPTWLVEGVSDTPIDFLDPSAAKRISATKPEVDSTDKPRKTKHTFLTTEDGKLIIKDEDEMEDADKKKIHWKQKNKQGVMEADDSDDEKTPASSYKAGNKRKSGEGFEGMKKQRNIKYGTEYKSKKARGDVKLKDKPDPYAYIPLNRQTLNRRKKAKLSGQYVGMVKAMRRGSAKAKKIISRKMKKN